MVVFNLHFGQARPKLLSKGRPVEMVHRHTTPKREIQMSRQASGRATCPYRADELGNIEVTDEEDILNLGPHQRVDGVEVGLGYPLYIGEGVGPVTREDLLFWLEPLDEEKYRILTEQEWAVHFEAVVESYIKAACEDAERGQLRPAGLERYVRTINQLSQGSDPVQVGGFLNEVMALGKRRAAEAQEKAQKQMDQLQSQVGG